MASSILLAHQLNARARIVVGRLSLPRCVLGRLAADVQLPPVSFPHHPARKALPLKQLPSAGFPFPIVRGLTRCWWLGAHAPLPRLPRLHVNNLQGERQSGLLVGNECRALPESVRNAAPLLSISAYPIWGWSFKLRRAQLVKRRVKNINEHQSRGTVRALFGLWLVTGRRRTRVISKQCG
jgi:hypothetical protein